MVSPAPPKWTFRARSRGYILPGATPGDDIAAMRDLIDRRRLLTLLASLPGLMTPAAAGRAASPSGGEHDFDFFLGSWTVRHRRLGRRLVGSNDWDEFDGTTTCQAILGGFANFNDSVSRRPGGISRGMGLRAYDPKTSTWADWYLDGRNPTKIEVHGLGRFAGGVGTFFSEDTWDGRAVKVRGIFTPLTPTSMQWEQAYSADGGESWETNYVMRYDRVAQGGM